MNKIIYTICLFSCYSFLVKAAYAEYIPPGTIDVHTVNYLPKESKLRYGKFEYSLGWQGIPVASAVIEIEPLKLSDKVQTIQVRIDTKTASFISVFYTLRHHLECIFESPDFVPRSYYSYKIENSKHKSRHILFRKDGKVQVKLWRKGKKGEEQSFQVHNKMLDPITATFLARALPIEVGKAMTFDVYNGKHRYLIKFETIKKETIKVAGRQREAFKLKPVIKKLTDSKGLKKLRSAYIWVSADADRDLLELESEVWIGKVSGKLKKYTPLKINPVNKTQDITPVNAKDSPSIKAQF